MNEEFKNNEEIREEELENVSGGTSGRGEELPPEKFCEVCGRRMWLSGDKRVSGYYWCDYCMHYYH